MSGKRTRALRAELKVNLPAASQSDHRAYRKSVRDLRQMKVGTPRPRRPRPTPPVYAYDGNMSKLSHRRFWG